MKNLFATTIKYDKCQEDGTFKSVSESYLVDALSHADAENRIIEHMTPYINGEFEVSNVKRIKNCELVDPNSADYYYAVSYSMLTLDEKTGLEKDTKFRMLICAENFNAAVKAFYSAMEGTLGEFVLRAVKEEKYIDYIASTKE